MTDLTKEQRLAACDKTLESDFRDRSYAEVEDDYEWLISELKASWAREEIVRLPIQSAIHALHIAWEDTSDKYYQNVITELLAAIAKVKDMK